MTAGTITVEKADEWDVEGWTSVPNTLIRDKLLDPDGKWAFIWCASHSKEFAFKAEDLAEAGPYGRNHAREALRKCERHGWLTRHKKTDPRTGRIVATVWKLHPRPVPPEMRTFVESKAKKRSMSTEMKAAAAARNRRSEPAPAREGAGADTVQADPNNRRSGPAPARPGAGRPGAGRPGAGRVDVPSEEEKTTREDQREEEQSSDVEAAVPPAPAAPPPPPAEPPPINPADEDTWRCRSHRGLAADEWVPACGACARVRQKEERNRDKRLAAEREAAERVAEACRDRGWCDRAGRVQERPGVPMRPFVQCDHERSPVERAMELARAAEAAREAAERADDALDGGPGLDHVPGKPRFVRPSTLNNRATPGDIPQTVGA